MQLLHLIRNDDAAAAGEYPDLRAIPFLEHIDHVFQVFDMAALVGADCDALSVLLQRGIDDLRHRTVMPQMDNLGTGCLQDPAHDIDRGIVSVEQTGGGNETDLVAFADGISA